MIQAHYNDDIDVLVIEEEEYEDFDQSLELGGFVLDLDTDGDFLGLEIIDATQKLPLTAEDLDSIDEVNVTVDQDENLLRIQIELVIDGQRSTITSQYPQPATA